MPYHKLFFKPLAYVLLFFGGNCFAQQKKITLPDLALEYNIPEKWEVKSFFKGDWDKPGGNNVCPCAGVINSLKIPNGSDFDFVYFVAYPSSRGGFSADMRQGVWQYRFELISHSDTVETDHLLWVRQVSRFKLQGSSDRFKNNTVWRLNSRFGNTYYIIYFWAKSTLFREYTPDFEAIINSLKPIKN